MKLQISTLFSNHYEKLRGQTLRVIRCIPPDKLNWTYRTGKFTFADLVRHLAASKKFMFAETVCGNKSAYPGHEKDLAEDGDVVRYLNEMHVESMEIFRALSNEDLQKKCLTPGDVPITTWKWLRAMCEHEIHHRGQIYALLGMLGIAAPPLYGLTSEQVREESI